MHEMIEHQTVDAPDEAAVPAPVVSAVTPAAAEQPANAGDAAPAASAVPKARGRAIVVTSGKGGVGKTTTTANLGAALAANGARVVLVDADVGLRNLDIVMGLESRVRHHVLDVLEGKATLEETLVSDKRVPSLKLLAAAQTREKDDVDTAAFRDLIASLRERFDYVLIDCPAGIEKGFANAIVGADEALIVCTPEVSAVRDADRVVGLLGDERSVKLIVNRLRPALVRKGKMLSVDDVNAILRLPLIGVITDAPDVIVSTNKGEPVALDPGSTVGEAYRQIAQRIAGTLTAPPEIPREKSFFEKLFGGH
jgi:septum site-determining protein MinD